MAYINKNELDKILEKQHLIIAYIGAKLSIVNHIYDAHEKNIKPICGNRFLLFTAHNYYRSIIIDLSALFHKDKHEKNCFHKLYSIDDISQHLKPDIPTQVQAMIKQHSKDINSIVDRRNKEIAHYDFLAEPTITFDLGQLDIINKLFHTAKEILCLCGKEKLNQDERCGYDFNLSDHIESLNRLLKHN